MAANDNPAYNMVGTPFEVADTIHHELGHTLGLYHGGLSANPQLHAELSQRDELPVPNSRTRRMLTETTRWITRTACCFP